MPVKSPAPPDGPIQHPLEGAFSPPPADAPYEVSEPVKAEMLRVWAERAAQHEQALAPLKIGSPSGTVSAAPSAAPPLPTGPSPIGEGAPGPMGPSGLDVEQAPPAPSPGLSTTSTPPPAGGPPPPHQPPPAVDSSAPPRHQPAFSNSDSPARGLPSPIADPGKQITGGWGEAPALDYYALDGLELATLIRALWHALDQQIALDLRFGMAITYPQVRVRLTLQVLGSGEGSAINDLELSSPLYTLTAEKADTPDTPAGQIREDLNLVQPHKHRITVGGHTQFVDRS